MSQEASISRDIDELARKFPEVAAARDYGVDIAMLLANLERPVAERIRRHQIALDTYQKLRNARKL